MVKKLLANVGYASSISESGKSLGERNGNPLQYPCLGNPMDIGAWRATVHGVPKKLDTTEQLNSNDSKTAIPRTSLSIYTFLALTRCCGKTHHAVN